MSLGARKGALDSLAEFFRPGTTLAHAINFVLLPVLTILILILPPFSVLERLGSSLTTVGAAGGIVSGDGATLVVSSGSLTNELRMRLLKETKDRGSVNRLPNGLVAASDSYRLEIRGEGIAKGKMNLPLIGKAQAGDLVDIYGWVQGEWRWLSKADVSSDFAYASGQIDVLPASFVAVRANSPSPEISAWYAANATIDELAVGALSWLNPLWYTVGKEGSIAGIKSVYPASDRYKIVPTVRNLAGEEYQGAIVDQILRSDELTNRHIQALVSMVKTNQYAGVDLDYRGIDPALKERFSAFIENLSSTMRSEGKITTLSLPPPVRKGNGLDTGAYDWVNLGLSVDTVKLWPERDPVAYYSGMPEILDLATRNVDRRKIALVIDARSTERSNGSIRQIGFAEAMRLVARIDVKGATRIIAGETVTFLAPNLVPESGASGLFWDKKAKATSFKYRAADGEHVIWLENLYSLAYRLELAKRYNIKGIAFATITGDPVEVKLWSRLRAFRAGGELKVVEPTDLKFTQDWHSSDGSLGVSGKNSVDWIVPGFAGKYTVSLTVSEGTTEVEGPAVSIEVLAKAAPTPIPPTPIPPTPIPPTPVPPTAVSTVKTATVTPSSLPSSTPTRSGGTATTTRPPAGGAGTPGATATAVKATATPTRVVNTPTTKPTATSTPKR